MSYFKAHKYVAVKLMMLLKIINCETSGVVFICFAFDILVKPRAPSNVNFSKVADSVNISWTNPLGLSAMTYEVEINGTRSTIEEVCKLLCAFESAFIRELPFVQQGKDTCDES